MSYSFSIELKSAWYALKYFDTKEIPQNMVDQIGQGIPYASFSDVVKIQIAQSNKLTHTYEITCFLSKFVAFSKQSRALGKSWSLK